MVPWAPTGGGPAVAVLLVLLGGCLGGAGEAPGQPEAPSSAPWERSVLDDLADGRMAVYAFQATAAADVVVTSAYDIAGDKHAAMACAVEHAQPGAPVERMRGWAIGAPRGETLPDGRPASVQTFVSFGTNPTLGAAGQGTDIPGDEGFGFQNPGAPQTYSLAAGEWLVYAVGLGGTSPAELDAGSTWTLRVASRTPLVTERLPDSPLACGFGFRDLEAVQAHVGGFAFLGGQVGGRLEAVGPYGAYASFGAFDPTMVGTGQARLRLGDAEIDLAKELARFPLTAQGPTGIALEVDSWAGYDLTWVLTGLWTPGVTVA